MAVIAQTVLTGATGVTLAVTTLTSSDTLVYRQGAGQMLILDNVTGGSLDVVLNDSDITSVQVDGVGPVSVSAGLSTTVASGVRKVILLDNSRRRWNGTIAVTGGTGIEAVLTAAN